MIPDNQVRRRGVYLGTCQRGGVYRPQSSKIKGNINLVFIPKFLARLKASLLLSTWDSFSGIIRAKTLWVSTAFLHKAKTDEVP